MAKLFKMPSRETRVYYVNKIDELCKLRNSQRSVRFSDKGEWGSPQ